MRQTHLELLQRVDLAPPLSHVLRDIAGRYQLGRLISWRIITQGYDDLNVLLVCERGKYVTKFFNKAKSFTTIADHVGVQLALSQRHAPVPRLLAPDGEGITRVPGPTHEIYVCVSEFFAGDNFDQRMPQSDDILAGARFLARLHKLPLKVAHSYDSWGTLNLPHEFAHKQSFVSHETTMLVAPLAEAVANLKFGKARRRIIHGDLQRKHVLKNSDGRYCVLDFGCMDYSYPIVDLGVFLALFCLEGCEPGRAQQMVSDVLVAYCALAPLPARHIALLSALIRATWASYLLTAEFLMRLGDRSHQTRQWYRDALTNLRAFDGVL